MPPALRRPIRLLPALLCTALAAVPEPAPAAAEAAPGRRPITLDDLSRFREVDDPRLSPDGGWVAYVVASHDVEADRPVSHLWLASWDGATSVQLTSGAGEARRPRWSPDGKSLAFLSDRGDEAAGTQAWLVPRAGGEPRRLTSAPTDVEDLAWSPDGARLVVVRREAGSATAGAGGGKEPAPPPIVIDRYYFKEDETGYLTAARRHLFLVDVATGREAALTRGEREDLNPAWSPDGSSLAFVSQVGADGDRTLAWEVFVMEPRPGAARAAPPASPGVRTAGSSPSCRAARRGCSTTRRHGSPRCRRRAGRCASSRPGSTAG